MSQRPYQGSRGGGGISEFQAYNDQGNNGGGGGGGYSRGGRGGGGGGGNDYYNNRNNNRNDNRNYHRQKQQDQGYDNFKDGGDYGSQSSQQLSNSGEEAVVQKITFAVVCASNQNRSMSAHYLLQKKYRMNVSSFGTGSSVKLPGRTRDTPNIYDFGTSYQDIFNDLKSQDEEYYTRLGLLKMLTRNAQIKRAPEKWQENINHFDVVITFEDRVFDAVIESMIANQTMYDRPTHIININVKDTPEEAERNAKYIAEFAKRLNESEDWENDVKHEIVKFEQQYGEKLMHLVLFA